MDIVKTGNLIIGEGLPKICVPLMAMSLDDLQKETILAAKSGCDLIEWRLDRLNTWNIGSAFRNKEDALEEIKKGMGIIRQATSVPVILTLRTSEEGGYAELSRRDYYTIIRDIIESAEPAISQDDMMIDRFEDSEIKRRTEDGFAENNCWPPDIIDIEAFDQDDEDGFDKVEFIVNLAKENGLAVILSNHDFDKTPPADEIIKRICIMDRLGADIPKVAYMPQSEKDVQTVIRAAYDARECCKKPFIALSMGREGLITRICSGRAGTAVTFASVSGQSAPGQVSVSYMKYLLERYYRNESVNENLQQNKQENE